MFFACVYCIIYLTDAAFWMLDNIIFYNLALADNVAYVELPFEQH